MHNMGIHSGCLDDEICILESELDFLYSHSFRLNMKNFSFMQYFINRSELSP
jgi:hypothetical protein